MSLTIVLRRVFGALEQAGIPFMLTGSFASSFHGAPRATQDIDLVIAPTAEQLRDFAGSLPPGEFYIDLEAALDALERQGQFNVIDFATGWKIDLILRKSRAFSLVEFGRRNVIEFQGMSFAIATPEDVILAKLEWAKLGASERQVDDAAEILRIRGKELDFSYLQEWVGRLELHRQWEAARRRSGTSA